MKKRKKLYAPHWRPGMNIQKQRKRRKVFRTVFTTVTLLVLFFALWALHLFVLPVGKRSIEGYAYVRNNSSAQEIIAQLDSTLHLKTPKLFSFYSKVIGLDGRLRPGKYAIKGAMSSAQLLMALIHSAQVPVKVTFNAVRTQEELVKKLTAELAMSADELQKKLADPQYCASMGCDTATIRTIFFPDSYEVYWNTSPEQLIAKIFANYTDFWTDKRRQQAENEGLTPQQISIIASIVEEESAKVEEYSRIAGLYINRLRKGIPLQADPTVKYALGDFSLKRILTAHTTVRSPYNTYAIIGLPPGPIRYPQKSTLEKVINFEHHRYLYMCANPDFSGSHVFATNYTDHLQNAYHYRKKLDEMGIQ